MKSMRSMLRAARRGAAVWLVFLAAGAAPAAPLEFTPRPAVAPGELKGGKPEIVILEENNADLSPWAEYFTFDPPDHPKLVELRQRYRLDELVAGAKTDLERALRLKKWVAGALRFGTPSPDVFQNWSAVALLEHSERGHAVQCGQAATVLQQACMALGMLARFIELGLPDNPANHFTTEIFLREHGKWAVVDPTPLRGYDTYYTVNGIPQSALEMHRRVVGGGMEEVIEVHPNGSIPAVSGGPAWCFYYLRWVLRCDVLTSAPRFVDMENAFDRRCHSVEWEDARTVPWARGRPTFWIRNEQLSNWRTSDPEVPYWKPSDRVRIVLRAVEGDAHGGLACGINAQFWTADVGFDRFQVRFEGAEWISAISIWAPGHVPQMASVGGQEWLNLPRGNTRGIWGTTFSFGPRFFTVRTGWNPWQPDREFKVRARVLRRDGSAGPESFVRFKLARKPD